MEGPYSGPSLPDGESSVSYGMVVSEGRDCSRIVVSISRGEGPALPGRKGGGIRGSKWAHCSELNRGMVGWGGAEWALSLPALCPGTHLGEQISFTDHCVLCVTPGECIEVY